MASNIVELPFHHSMLLAVVSNTKTRTPLSNSKSFTNLNKHFAIISPVPSEISGDSIKCPERLDGELRAITGLSSVFPSINFLIFPSKWKTKNVSLNYLKDAKESLISFASVWTQLFLWQRIVKILRLASFKSAPPALNNFVTNFISFLLLVLVVAHVAARTFEMLFAGKLRVTLSSVLVISLHFRNGSSHSSPLDALDTLSSLDWTSSLQLLFAMFFFVKHYHFDFPIIFSFDINTLENIALLSSDCCAMADGSPQFFFMCANGSAAFSSL